MVTTTSISTNFTKQLGKVVGVWWLLSTVSSLLLIQPFEMFLRAQANTAHLQAFDPFVLLVTAQREQRSLSTALATTTALLFVSVLVAQLPLAFSLVSLAHGARARRAAFSRTLRVLPPLVGVSLLADVVPLLALLLVVVNPGAWAAIVVDGTLGTFVCSLLVAWILLVGWLFGLVWLDLTRVAVVARAGKPSVVTSARDGARAVAHAPLSLFLRGTLARAASFACLTGPLLCLHLSQTDHPIVPFLAWLTTQGGVILALGVRVWWLAWATRYYSLRPPSLNN